MAQPKLSARKFNRKLLLLALVGIAVGGAGLSGAMSAPLSAQSAATSAQATNSPPVPQWQIDAGGRMAFDVASVKQNTGPVVAGTLLSNVSLGPMDDFVPTGGLFSAPQEPLLQYLIFAFKLPFYQSAVIFTQLPSWAQTNRYEIEARASGNPTKDQFRLMLQALLAERFKLAIHREIRQLPVYELVLDKPGKLGPQLQQHSAETPCTYTTAITYVGAPPPPTVAGGFPESCGRIAGWLLNNPHRIREGARNIPLAMFAAQISASRVGVSPRLDRPILDRTGLTGNFDFIFEWSPEPPVANPQADPEGPTFQEALKKQLGLKLQPSTGPVEVFVLDHIEPPSAN